MSAQKIILSTLALLFTSSLWAHDQAEHAKNAEAPDCAALTKMDMSKMKEHDPVIMALFQQCQQDVKDSKNMNHMNHKKEVGGDHDMTRMDHKNMQGQHH